MDQYRRISEYIEQLYHIIDHQVLIISVQTLVDSNNTEVAKDYISPVIQKKEYISEQTYSAKLSGKLRFPYRIRSVSYLSKLSLLRRNCIAVIG